MPDSLQGLVLPGVYQQTRAHIFPSPQSLAWFVRQHRDELAKAGALHIVAGRNLLDEAKTDEVVLDVGKRAAARRMKSGVVAAA